MKLLPSLLAGALLFATPGTSVFAQEDLLRQDNVYSVVSWGHKDGIPSGGIRSLTQDRDGYLWVGTNFGLLRFDGVSFVSLDAISRSPLPRRAVQQLVQARDGALWVGLGGAAGGVARLQNGEVRLFGANEGLADGSVNGLLEDGDGHIWTSNPRGLFEWTGSAWRRVGVENGLPEGAVFSILSDRTGRLVVGMANEVFSRSRAGAKFQRLDVTTDRVAGLAEGRKGGIYITDPVTGVRTIGVGNTLAAARGRGTRLLFDGGGGLWVGTAGQGLWRADARLGASEPDVAGLNPVNVLGDWVLGLLEDRNGSIWVATDAGLNKLTKVQMVAVSSLSTASAIDLSPNGDVWVETTSALLKIVNTRGRWTVQARISAPSLRALEVDERGKVWVASDNGLYAVVDDRLVSLGKASDDPGLGKITSIASDTHGGLWLYIRGVGPVHWNDGLKDRLPWSPDFEAGPGVSAFTDSRGEVWFASGHPGIRVFEPGASKVESVTARNGLDPDDYGIVYEGIDGAIWLGGRGALTRYRDGRFQTISKSNGFPEEVLRSIVEDTHGGLWLGTGSGIVRLDRAEFDKAVTQPGYQVNYRLYDVADGVAGLPIFNGSRSAIRTDDGHLWFLTERGVTVIDPDTITDVPPPTRVTIVAISGDGSRLTGPAITFPSRTDAIEFKYSALDLVSPQKLMFRYRLESFDKSWNEGSSDHLARYAGLPPGQYRFRVTANNGEQVAAPVEAVMQFTIEPVFYRTMWFYALLTAFTIAAIWGAWQFRLWELHRTYTAILEERTRVGRAIHDTLLQSLIGIAWQCDVIAHEVEAASSGLSEKVVDLRDLIERQIREARHSIWELRSPLLERRDLSLALKAFGEEAATEANVEFVYEIKGVPRRQDDMLEEQILRIGQEAVLNAIRHGKPSRITLELQYSDDVIRLSVADNGGGFETAVLSRPRDGHYGVAGMRERAERVGGTLSIRSAPRKGTRVEATIPCESIPRVTAGAA